MEHQFITELKARLEADKVSVRQAAIRIARASGGRISKRTIEAACTGDIPLSFDSFLIIREEVNRFLSKKIKFDAGDFYRVRSEQHGY